MNRKFGIGILIFCFGLSGVDAALADQAVEVQPIVVQPDDLRDISQQMLTQDRINRDQELAIKGLIDDNQTLTATALAHQQDATLEKINQTLINYRDSLIARDRARIAANGERYSKYYDLIKLTEFVDDLRDAGGLNGIGNTLELKRDVIDEKYQILTDLKNEMIALNEKLKGQGTNENTTKTDDQQAVKIQMLTQRLGEMDQRIAKYDEIIAQKDQQILQLKDTIKNQKDQIDILQGTSKGLSSYQMVKAKQDQVDLLKSELENKITELNGQGPKDEIIKQQEDQIAMLKAQSQELSSKGDMIKSQADQMVQATEQFKDQGAGFTDVKTQIMALRNMVQEQAIDLKAKDDSIRWLNQVLDVTKNKAEYYKLTSQQEHLTVNQVQEEMQKIKDDFAKQSLQLSQKQGQVDLLKSELENKITELKDQKDQMIKMKAIDQSNAPARVDDRIKLAKELIDLQGQEAALLDEKSGLEASYNTIFEQHVLDLESKIKEFLANHQMQTADLQNHMQELQSELDQKEQQVGSLNAELKNKIAQQANQSALAEQIQGLKTQLQDEDDQIASMKKKIQEGQKTNEEVDSLKQQLVIQQDKADQFKQQLDSKISQSGQMTLLMADYQKKLESKDNAYNDQLRQVLSSKNDQAMMEKEIANLNARLQEKEKQVINIKKDMYDLQELSDAKDRDAQTKDLSLSMIQQKAADDKINEFQEEINGLKGTSVRQVQEIRSLRTDLALARQQLEGMPSSDEIDFLRTGLKKATVELKEKSDMLLEIKTNADEYVKEFKAQTQEFQSLKDQLLDAQQEIQRRDEDLKYKDMEVTRLKDRDQMSEKDLKAQVMVLTQRVEAAEKNLMGKTHENKVEALQAQLKSANLQIKNLKAQLDQLRILTKNDTAEEKIKQALDKIDEQGRMINVLTQKLLDCGQSADLSKVAAKQ